MNIYFSPTQRNELNFPTSRLSITLTNPVTNSNEVKEIDYDFDKEEIEVNQFYKKYESKKSLFEKTKAQKKLNKIKVYFLVKSKIVKGKEVQFAVPIRSFDDLGNSILEKSSAFIAGVFYLRVEDHINGLEYIEGSPGARPFYLDHMVHPEPPFGAEQELSLENFRLPKRYVANGDKLELSKDAINDPYKMVVEDPVFNDDPFGEVRSFFSFFGEYEYNDSMIDNTFLLNSSRYKTDIRSKNSFNGEIEGTGFLSRLKELELKENPFKLFNMSNIFSVVFGNISSSVDKNIIPIFSNLEDAQELLITTLEELNQPFQVRRKIETPSTAQYSKSLTYLDDSFSFQNHFFLPAPTNRIARIKALLNTFRLNKSIDIVMGSSDEFYNEAKYQTKGPFFLEDVEPSNNDVYIPMSQKPKSAPKCIWREIDYWSFIDYYFPGEPETYSWWESRDMSYTDKGLLKKSQDIKIISMGLGDFLEFWNNHTKKNAEVLFVPSLNNFSNRKPLLIPKKKRDKFYDYQQKFRGVKKQETENYIYEIKTSSE